MGVSDEDKERHIMRRKTVAVLGVLLAAATIAGCTRSEGQSKKIAEPAKVNNAGAPREQAAPGPGVSPAAEAMRRAASDDKYLFIFFFRADDEPTRLAKKALDEAVRKMDRAAGSVSVNVADSSEAEIVNKYNLRSTPMPVVLAFAPNGALTGGFRSADISEQKLKSAIASRGAQECLKALQERKIVFICIQSKKTQFNREARKGVDEFKADARYGPYTAVVEIDPVDATERSFLTQLKIDSNAKDAATALLVPPNMVLGVTNGPTSKASFLQMLASASSGCGGSTGCAPGACGPAKK
jgi:hypothetical protein